MTETSLKETLINFVFILISFRHVGKQSRISMEICRGGEKGFQGKINIWLEDKKRGKWSKENKIMEE